MLNTPNAATTQIIGRPKARIWCTWWVSRQMKQQRNPPGRSQRNLFLRRATAPEVRWEDTFNLSHQGIPKSEIQRPEETGNWQPPVYTFPAPLCEWAERHTATSHPHCGKKIKIWKWWSCIRAWVGEDLSKGMGEGTEAVRSKRKWPATWGAREPSASDGRGHTCVRLPEGSLARRDRSLWPVSQCLGTSPEEITRGW